MGLRPVDVNFVNNLEDVAVFWYRTADLSQAPQFMGRVGFGIFESLTKNLGSIERTLAPDPERRGRYVIIRKQRGAPDLGEVTFNEFLNANTRNVLEEIARLECDITLLVAMTNCGRPDVIANGKSWLAVTGANLVDLEYADVQAREAGNDALVNGTINADWAERIFPVQLQEKADSTILAEIVDLIYADEVDCGNCGAFSDGCTALFAVTKANAASPGLSSQVVYTINGTAYNTVDITTLDPTNDADGIIEVGQYIVVCSAADESHHYALKSLFETGTPIWTEVTGYETGGGPVKMASLGPTLTFAVGLGGYVYKLTSATGAPTTVHDATLTTEDGNDIVARGQTVVTAHDNNVILLSRNLGTTWSLVTGPAVGQNVNTVALTEFGAIFAGMANGTLYYTVDDGVNWTQITDITDSDSITAVNHLKFSPDNPNVGGMVVNKGGLDSFLYRTLDGGRSWDYQDWIAIQLGTTPERYNRLDLCSMDKIAAGGLESAGDGILAIADEVSL